MLKKIIAACALAIVPGVCLTAVPATAATSLDLWIIDRDGELYSVEPATGLTIDDIGATGVVGAIGGGLNVPDGVVYVSDDSCDIHSVNVADASSASVGSLQGPIDGRAIQSCDAATMDGQGNLWVLAENGTGYYVVTFNIAALTTTVVGGDLGDYLDSLWFDPTDGSLHGMFDGSGNYIAIDTTTGAVTDSGSQLSPYSYGVVVDGSGNYFANTWSGLATGVTSDYSTATTLSVNYGSGSWGVSTLFTTTNFWPEAPTTLPDTGVSSSVLIAVGAGALALIAAGMGLLARRRAFTK
jgi:LPXTG-motif cell wall-anchored protein